jgi:hypothetical protein
MFSVAYKTANMKKILFALIMVACISVRAQQYYPLVETGKIWSTGFRVGYPPYSQHTDFIKFEGDTVINGLTYRKIMITPDSLLTGWALWSYIREDGSHKVYHYNSWQGMEFLLYDFDVVVGDTVMVNQSPSGLLLDSVYTMTMENGELRTAYRWMDLNIPTGYPPLFETWVQGVGSFLGVLQSGMATAVGGYSYNLCMHENDTLIYQREGNNSCTVITSVFTAEFLPELSIRQTGGDGRFVINFSQPGMSPVTMKIADLMGKTVYSMKASSTFETVVDLSAQPAGLYILNLSNDQINLSRKFFRR